MTQVESNEQYHADRTCISASMLKTFHESVRKYHDRYVSQVEQEEVKNRGMTLGTMAHTAILEPERWTREYIVAPSWTRGNKKLFENYARECALPGVTVISVDDGRAVKQMAESAHRVAGRLLALDGAVEQSMRVQDKETGLWLKIKPDKNLVVPAILDIKTTYDVSERQFWFTAKKFLYALQEVHYCDVVEQLEGVRKEFHFIAVQSRKDFGAALCRMPDNWRQGAKALRRKLLRELAECYATNRWVERPSQQVEPTEEFVETGVKPASFDF